MFRRHPETRTMFSFRKPPTYTDEEGRRRQQIAGFGYHMGHVSSVFDRAVQGLAYPDLLRDLVKMERMRHSHLHKISLDIMKDIMTDFESEVASVLGSKYYTPDVQAAWREFLLLFFYHMTSTDYSPLAEEINFDRFATASIVSSTVTAVKPVCSEELERCIRGVTLENMFVC